MKLELKNQILELQPDWFVELIDIECGDGWFDLLYNLVRKLVMLSTEDPDSFLGFKILEIKCNASQTLDVLFETCCEVFSRRADALILAYKYMASMICNVCGESLHGHLSVHENH